MDTHSFYAEISVYIEFSDEDFELIKECMLHHYDYTVKSSAEAGGFWYGFWNTRTWAKENKKSDLENYNPNIRLFTEREIGLILKSIEMSDSPLSDKIRKRLYGIIRELHHKWDEVNNQLNSVPL